MPYMIVKKGENKFCVHHKDKGGEAGDVMKCYTGDNAKNDASDYLRALYANSKDLSSSASLDRKVNEVREAYYQKSNPQPPQVVNDYNTGYIQEVFEDHVIINKGGELYKCQYKHEGGEIVFAPEAEWTEVQIEYKESVNMTGTQVANMHDQFLFVELKAGDLVSAFDGMAHGSFRDMRGTPVTFGKKDLPEFVKNTNDVILSTKTEKGEIVGLPIDTSNHDHQGGAGWIKSVELDSKKDVIRFKASWTETGKELIANDIRRFFSPSVDLENKVILGGSLTNWPATRGPKGHMLLRPIELSQEILSIQAEDAGAGLAPGLLETLKELGREVLARFKSSNGAGVQPEQKGVVEMTGAQNNNPTPPSTGVSPVLLDLLSTPEAVAEMAKRATTQANEMIAADRRKNEVIEFASQLVGGTIERPYGLPIKAEDVAMVLLSLPEAQSKAVQHLLTQTQTAVIQFMEKGTGRTVHFEASDFIHKNKLDPKYAKHLKTWVESGKKVSEFFSNNPEIGEMKDFDVKEFVAIEVSKKGGN